MKRGIMKHWNIVVYEIKHRKLGFCAGLLSLTAATAGALIIVLQLRAHDLSTENIVIETEKNLRSEMTQLENRYRRIMRDMGHNVLIMNKEQDMAGFRRLGHPDTYMDYDDVWKLAHGDLTTLNHLLPVLQKRIFWEEQETGIMLSGISGQVPVFTKPEFLTEDHQYRSPIVRRIPDGMANLGAEIAVALNLRPGETITLAGREFVINRIHARRGNDDDFTVSIPLHDAQEILGKENRINGIFALECVCSLDDLGKIHAEVEAILPHAKVYEFSSLIAPRAKVRQQAAEAHRRVVASVLQQRDEMRRDKERRAAVLLPLLFSGAALWIMLTIFANVRERRGEIGILRALGFLRREILAIFLLKALLMGVIGGFAGCALGLYGGIVWSGVAITKANVLTLLDPVMPVAALLAAPVLACLASVIPALAAAHIDPAKILAED